MKKQRKAIKHTSTTSGSSSAMTFAYAYDAQDHSAKGLKAYRKSKTETYLKDVALIDREFNRIARLLRALSRNYYVETPYGQIQFMKDE